MRGSTVCNSYSIEHILRVYYKEAPLRLSRLQRQQGWIEQRIALLENDLGDVAIRSIHDFTLPGTIGNYNGPAGRSQQVSNPTMTAVIRLRAVEGKALCELRKLHGEKFDIEQEIDALTQFRAIIEDILNVMDQDDKNLLKYRYADNLTYEAIACRMDSGESESVPRKRLHLLEQQIAESLQDSRSFTRAALRPFSSRKGAASGPKVGRS
jgi:hypothetical protein